jgi:hypothetical protein
MTTLTIGHVQLPAVLEAVYQARPGVPPDCWGQERSCPEPYYQLQTEQMR